MVTFPLLRELPRFHNRVYLLQNHLLFNCSLRQPFLQVIVDHSEPNDLGFLICPHFLLYQSQLLQNLVILLFGDFCLIELF